MGSQLDTFFSPQGVAVIGASADPTKLSYGVISNLKNHGYPGPIYPVHPEAQAILGLPAYRSIRDVPDPIELAVIMVAAAKVPDTLEECGRRGLKAAIIVSGGFKEAGPEGAYLESLLLPIAERYGMRLIGPNCVGVMDTHTPLDTTFITAMPDPGATAFVSHSGAVCGGTIDWALSVGVGFSRIASLGNQVDVDIADGIRAMGDDPHTRVISVYAEGLPDGLRFVEAAQQVYRHKPIVVLKAGRTSAGTRAVASHTGALAGAGRAYAAACHRAGVMMAKSLQQQSDMATALALQPLPQGRRVVLLTNAGGPAALSADALDEAGLCMADLTAETQDRLREVCPRGTLTANPVDMLGGPLPSMYTDAVRVLLEDPGVDMVLALFVPQAVTPVDEVAKCIVAAASGASKPVVACIVGGATIADALRILHRGDVPAYSDPNRAGLALAALWEYAQLRVRPDLTPEPLTDVDKPLARELLLAAWEEGDTSAQPCFLDAERSAQVLAAYGLHLPFSGLARTVDQAVDLARQARFPVAMKLVAPGVVHKADVGGVALNLTDEAAVRSAFKRMTERMTRDGVGEGARPECCAMIQGMVGMGHEVILGVQRDPQFGPVLMFGMGGIYVEVLRDVAFRLAPIGRHDAEQMLAETAAGKLLYGVRGQTAGDVDAVVDAVRRIGQLASDFSCIAEMDVNPLIVCKKGQGAWAVDARIALSGPPA